ncbi:EamA family transporter RarD [Kitasatospora kifunensis]|uniref:Chloramphenicol-sensitive protein RarD n=1 Tax=Kitasatospora kifunensis TaxID=58351 RepID=A0A7W7VV45_KITKI|nr:EamA family transporter RarD [Kitasatospora kifunensis]MBB4924012.1 chloramphenicol-sensitive protein RarD [Kitasatospora kifunensis]
MAPEIQGGQGSRGSQSELGRGVWLGAAAYGIWGLFPLYWPLLEPSSSADILANRMVWSLVVAAAILTVRRHWSWVRPLLSQPRRLALSALAAAAISLNWGVYIWAVNSGHVVESSLGYFINPLVTIAFGVLLLRERLRIAQWSAVGVGALAVVVLAVGYGQLPWIALTLAFTFAVYGLLKKKVALGGLESFALETAFIFPFALAFLIYRSATGHAVFGHGAGHLTLLLLTGPITAIPLLMFGAAAIRIPLSTMGLLQYLAPVFQFLCGVLYFHEAMPPARWAGFTLVWAALAVLTWDAVRRVRADRSGSAVAQTAAPAPVPAPEPAPSVTR